MKNYILSIFAMVSFWGCFLDDRYIDEKHFQREFPFEFSVKTETEFFLKSLGSFEMEIKNQKEKRDQEYEITYELSKEGEIFLDDKKMKDTFFIKKGTHKLDFKGLISGKYKLKFKASNGNEKYDQKTELEIEVKNIDFELSLNPIDKSIEFGKTGRLSFDFKPKFINQNEKTKYKLHYSCDLGTLKFGDKLLESGESIELKDEAIENQTLVFTPKKYAQAADIKLTVEDQYGYKKEIHAQIKIEVQPFELFVSSLSNDFVDLNKPKRFKLDLKTKGDPAVMHYKLRISSPSNDLGKLIYGGTEYSFNDDIPLIKGISHIDYIPTEYGSGKHMLDFQATDLIGQRPTNQVQTQTVLVYKEMKIKYIKLDRTKKRVSSGDLLNRSKHDFRYYLSFDIEAQGIIKGVKIDGFDEREKIPFSVTYKASGDKITGNQMTDILFAQLDRVTSANLKDRFAPGSKLTITFTDQAGKKLSVTETMQERK